MSKLEISVFLFIRSHMWVRLEMGGGDPACGNHIKAELAYISIKICRLMGWIHKYMHDSLNV